MLAESRHIRGVGSRSSRHGRLELAFLSLEPKGVKAVQTSPAMIITDGMMHSGATAVSPEDEMMG